MKNNFVIVNKKIMLSSIGVVINASSILILYFLVYVLFYKYRSFEHNINVFNEYININDNRLRNMVKDINHNDQVLKNSLS